MSMEKNSNFEKNLLKRFYASPKCIFTYIKKNISLFLCIKKVKKDQETWYSQTVTQVSTNHANNSNC